MKNSIFPLNKALGSYGTMYTTSVQYIMAFNIQDPNTNVGYDFVKYIITKMHDEIVVAQERRLENFKFFHYSMLMHLILFRNVDLFDQSFFECIEEWGERLSVQRWIRV